MMIDEIFEAQFKNWPKDKKPERYYFASVEEEDDEVLWRDCNDMEEKLTLAS